MNIDTIIEKWTNGEIDNAKARILLQLEEKQLDSFLGNIENMVENPKGRYTWESEGFYSHWQAWNTYQGKLEASERVRAFAFLIGLEETNKAPDTNTAACSPMVWKGAKADLARIYKELRENKLIDITGRDFSLHFLDKNGNPMPLDFLEACGSKQDELSKNQGVQKTQLLIRGMKPDSGE